MEIPKFIGPDILPELRRQLKLDPVHRPLMGVLTTDPVHKGGIEYVPVELAALVTRFDEESEVLDVGVTFVMREGNRKAMWVGATYNPRDNTQSPDGRNILALKVYCSR